MDLGTTATVVGIVAALVYVVETAHKYGSAILKKITTRHVQDKTTHDLKKFTGATSKNIIALLDGAARQILSVDLNEFNPTNLNGYASCPRRYFFKKI